MTCQELKEGDFRTLIFSYTISNLLMGYFNNQLDLRTASFPFKWMIDKVTERIRDSLEVSNTLSSSISIEMKKIYLCMHFVCHLVPDLQHHLTVSLFMVILGILSALSSQSPLLILSRPKASFYSSRYSYSVANCYFTQRFIDS